MLFTPYTLSYLYGHYCDYVQTTLKDRQYVENNIVNSIQKTEGEIVDNYQTNPVLCILAK